MTKTTENLTTTARRSSKLRKLATGIFVVSAASTAGLAFAAWNTTGSGNATARAVSAQVLTTVDATASTGATLYPGATGDARLTINNPNPYAVRVTSIAGNGAITSDKGAACNASTGVAFTSPTGTFDVPAASAASFTLAGAVAMTNASDNACQGAVFTIPVTLTGASNG
jgi:hypothetical protein